jgi:hypothetical protein
LSVLCQNCCFSYSHDKKIIYDVFPSFFATNKAPWSSVTEEFFSFILICNIVHCFILLRFVQKFKFSLFFRNEKIPSSSFIISKKLIIKLFYSFKVCAKIQIFIIFLKWKTSFLFIHNFKKTNNQIFSFSFNNSITQKSIS